MGDGNVTEGDAAAAVVKGLDEDWPAVVCVADCLDSPQIGDF